MNRRSLLAALGTAGLAGCLGGDGQATSSPTTNSTPPPATPDDIDSSWPRPAHDAGLTNYAPEATGPPDRPDELWHTSASGSLSMPVVADGTVYVASEGTVHALDARTGERRWRAPVGAPAHAPRVVDGRVYVPTAESVVALAADGTERWLVETPNRTGFLAAAHGLYSLSAGEDPALVARAHADGSERWRASIRDPWAPPVFAGAGQVFVTTGGSWDRPWRFAVDTGEYLGVECPPSGGADFVVSQCYREGAVFGATELFSTVSAEPVTDDGHDWSASVDDAACFELACGADRLYAHGTCADRTGLFALSLSDGNKRWYSDAVSDAVARPVVTDDAVFVRTDGELVCVDSEDGSERWRRSAADLGTRIAVADDLLFTTQGGTVRALR